MDRRGCLGLAALGITAMYRLHSLIPGEIPLYYQR